MTRSKKKSGQPPAFSRRERQVMDVLYRLGEGAVADVEAQMPGAPSYDAVRLILVALTEKGHLNHRRDGRRYVYWPKTPATEASRSALRQVTKTYFKGSPKRGGFGASGRVRQRALVRGTGRDRGLDREGA